MNSFAIDGVAIWLAILWLAGTTMLSSPGQRIATFLFGIVALGTAIWLFFPHLWGDSVSGMTIIGLLIGVAEAVVVRTRLLKQDEVTQAADKNTIGIVIFLGLWVAALIAGAALSDV